MAPVSPSVTRALAPGDIVVSLADIVDKLGGKLSQSDINDLMRAILSKRKNEVRPGDLITSDLMNQVLAELADLQVRVAKLESGDPGVLAPVILEPRSGERLEINQKVQIKGLNFGYSTGKQRVEFDGVPVSGFADGSSNTLLIVFVPPLPNLTQPRSVVLMVSNGVNSTTQTVTVAPPTIPIEGTVDIISEKPEPLPIKSGEDATFPFLLSPRSLTRAAEFLVEVKFIGPAWTDRIKVLGPDKGVLPGQKIPIEPNKPMRVYARINPVPPNSDNTQFSIGLSVSAGNARGSSQLKRYAVNKPPEARDETITLVMGNPSRPGAVVGGTIQLKTGEDVEIPVTISSSKAGTFEYDVSISLIPTQPGGQPATKWSFQLYEPPPTDPAKPGIGRTPAFSVSKDIRFGAMPDSGASSEGRLEVKIQRLGDPLFQTMELGLKLLPSG
jgi:hypothetical protein